MGQKQLFKDILTKNFQKLVRKNQISYLRSFMNPKQEHTHTHTHTHTELHHTQNAEDQKERKNFKAAKGGRRKHIAFKGAKIRLTANF